MLNLLPQDHKERVRQEYIRRFSIVSLLFFSSVCISLGVALFPAYTLTKLRKNIAEENIANIKNSPVVKDKNAVFSTIKDLETKMKIVSLVPGERATDFISKAVLLKDKGISIRNISYTKKDDSQKEVVLEGIARTRADLIAFSKRAKASTWATASDIPLSNLASEHDIPFLITLKITTTAQ